MTIRGTLIWLKTKRIMVAFLALAIIASLFILRWMVPISSVHLLDGIPSNRSFVEVCAEMGINQARFRIVNRGSRALGVEYSLPYRYCGISGTLLLDFWGDRLHTSAFVFDPSELGKLKKSLTDHLGSPVREERHDTVWAASSGLVEICLDYPITAGQRAGVWWYDVRLHRLKGIWWVLFVD